ncbi:MAG: DUF1800 family protein [Burkholderiaceae bacterium]|nr:DUF1800 family protein [Burkholderiaceae bacterium]
MSTQSTRPQASLLAALLAAALSTLSACGGGGGGGDGSSSAAATAPAASAATGSSTPETAAAAASAPTEAEAAAQAEATAAAMAAAAAAQVAAEAAAATAAAGASATDNTVSTSQVQGGSTVPDATPRITVRARATLAGDVGAMMSVRVDGTVVGSVEVRNTAFADHSFTLSSSLKAGAKVEVVYSNDSVALAGGDRNLHIAYVSDGQQVILPTATGALIDRGAADKAFDGLDTLAGQSDLWWNGALRLSWPAATSISATDLARRKEAARFLTQASFGPTAAEIDSVIAKGYAGWIDAQLALAHAPDYLNHVQAKYDLGDAYRPQGANYTPYWIGQKFWATAANAPDQLRKRVAHALQQIMVVSQIDSNLWWQARAYATYVDSLNRNAFGNFRTLMEDIALSPAMGIYLSHMRNRKEDAATGRVPDENFARELMQLFTIGLHELNSDGTLKKDGNGNAIETYSNADVMALAKVFTGWSWAFPDAELTDSKFRWSNPVTTAAGDTKLDTLPMKAYPGQHSTAEKKLFTGKSWAVTIPAGGTAQSDLKIALDTLFNHPNVGPFIGRQLIQRLVSSNPSPAYVARVAAVFNNNGKGVRGDLGAVVKAILLDSEARAGSTSSAAIKLREPALRLAHWLRALGASSASGQYTIVWDLDKPSQRQFGSPSVFNHYRPGYVPPNTSFAGRSATAPEFQIVNESTVAAWINLAEMMAGTGMGWNDATKSMDVSVNHATLGALTQSGNLGALVDHLDLMLLGGRMSANLRQAILDAAGAASGSSTDASVILANRARAAVFLTLASPEFVTQP